MATSSTPALSSPGIGSGLDINGIVSQLVAIEKQPIKNLQVKATTLQTKLSSVGQIQSQISTLSDVSTKLADSTVWSNMVATSSNSSAVTATASSTATSGSYSIEVQQLARAQTANSAVITGSSAVGTGTLSIQLGTWNAGMTSFDPGSNLAVSVSIGVGEDSLANIKAKINAANAGVTATVVTDASGDRLVIKSNATGEAKGFRVQVTDDDTLLNDGLGLSRLGFDPPTTTTGAMTIPTNQSAQNAKVAINGVVVSSATNTVTGAVTGLTIQANQVTTTNAEVTVGADTSTLRSNINNFVSAYNALNTLLVNSTAYDAGNDAAAPLLGDPTITGIMNTMRQMIGSVALGSTSYQRLSEVGLELQKGGSLKVNTTKLEAALKNVSEMGKLFTTDNSNKVTNGFGLKFKDYTAGLLGTSGQIVTETKSINAALARNSKDQQAITDRATLTETRLRKQYTALDTRLSSLSALNSYVTQQITQWNNVKTTN